MILRHMMIIVNKCGESNHKFTIQGLKENTYDKSPGVKEKVNNAFADMGG